MHPAEVIMPDGRRFMAFINDDGDVDHVEYHDGIMVDAKQTEEVKAFIVKVVEENRIPE